MADQRKYSLTSMKHAKQKEKADIWKTIEESFNF